MNHSLRTIQILFLLLLFSGCGPFHADVAVSWGASSIHREVTISNPQDLEGAFDEEQIVVPKPINPQPTTMSARPVRPILPPAVQ